MGPTYLLGPLSRWPRTGFMEQKGDFRHARLSRQHHRHRRIPPFRARSQQRRSLRNMRGPALLPDRNFVRRPGRCHWILLLVRKESEARPGRTRPARCRDLRKSIRPHVPRGPRPRLHRCLYNRIWSRAPLAYLQCRRCTPLYRSRAAHHLDGLYCDACSKTCSATQIGACSATPSAIASDGRESISTLRPLKPRCIFA